MADIRHIIVNTQNNGVSVNLYDQIDPNQYMEFDLVDGEVILPFEPPTLVTLV